MSIFQGVGNRGGVRGGKDQFSWDNVRGDKYKEYYLGQSIRLEPPGFGKQNAGWWLEGKLQTTQEKKPQVMKQITNQARKEIELSRIKMEEDRLMKEALGLAPKRRIETGKKLEKHELEEIFKKGNTERDSTDIERVSGLGYEPAVRPSSTGMTNELPHEEIEPSRNVFEREDKLVHVNSSKTRRSTIGPSPERDEDDDRKNKRHRKEKKDKHHHKKEKKEKKHNKRDKSKEDNETKDRRKRHKHD